jgi:hypothetical protein
MFPCEVDWADALESLTVDTTVGKCDWCQPGEEAAMLMLQRFTKADGNLKRFEKQRNDPNVEVCPSPLHRPRRTLTQSRAPGCLKSLALLPLWAARPSGQPPTCPAWLVIRTIRTQYMDSLQRAALHVREHGKSHSGGLLLCCLDRTAQLSSSHAV